LRGAPKIPAILAIATEPLAVIARPMIPDVKDKPVRKDLRQASFLQHTVPTFLQAIRQHQG
jgi:hypothetical protein